jgi:hypothetical protein
MMWLGMDRGGLNLVCRNEKEQLMLSMAVVAILFSGSVHSRPEGDESSTKIALVQVGLSPVALAAAGVSPDEYLNIVGRLTDTSLPSQMLDACSQAARSRADAQALQETARIRVRDQSQETQLEAAQVAIAVATDTERQRTLELVQSATSGLSEGQRARLTAATQNGQMQVPPAMRVATLNAEEWPKLELAVIAERRATRTRTRVSRDAAELLSRVRSQSAVVQAQVDIDRFAAGIEAALRAPNR